MTIECAFLVTGAAGRVGAVGRTVVEILPQRALPVRALVRREDERANALRAMGAEVVVGNLTRVGDVARALEGCQRMYFGMSVCPHLIWRGQSPPLPLCASVVIWRCSSTSYR